MAAVAPALPFISAGFSLLQGVAGAKAASEEAQSIAEQRFFEQRQAEDAAKDEILAATQEEVIRRRELNDTLSTIDAIRSARGLRTDSPTGKNIRRNIGKIAGENIRTGKINRLTRSNAFSQQARFAGRAGKDALSSGRTAAGISLLKGIGGAATEFLE